MVYLAKIIGNALVWWLGFIIGLPGALLVLFLFLMMFAKNFYFLFADIDD